MQPNDMEVPKILWQPSKSHIQKSRMWDFLNYVNRITNQQLDSYASLHQWSVEYAPLFWQLLWQYFEIIHSVPAKEIIVPAKHLKDTKWFIGAKLNFAENLLRFRDDHTALIFSGENNQRRTYTYQEVYKAVAKTAAYLKEKGVQKNDRVAAILPNIPETIIAMLATSSIGAIWSSCSPEFGKEALFDRLHQIKPKILFTSDGYFYGGKVFELEDKISWLRKKITTIEDVVVVNYVDKPISENPITFAELMARDTVELTFEQLPFDHPLYIMFSSGTTGEPKCIVHGAGGTLLQHLKELALHTNISRQDKFFYYTTCGWMMWNWYVSGLALGCTILQYEGSPFYPYPEKLFDFIEDEKITVFGTSAKYLSALHKANATPKKNHDLTSLRQILSTGSPLVPNNFEYVYEEIKDDVCLSSISGGTDIISCFALGNPILPVYQGELQCIGLGLDVAIYNEQGQSVIDEKGELVCRNAFPCMPIYFWNDPEGSLYFNSYFAKFPNVWAHGDFAEITPRETLIIYGRSDAVLNPGGVRIGTAEIYRQLEKMPEIMDSIAVSQEWEDDNRIILFIVLRANNKLDDALKAKIKQTIKNYCSPRHVPAKIIAVPEIPRTLSGKIVELAVREIIHERPVKNIASIANPDSLKYFKGIKELQTP